MLLDECTMIGGTAIREPSADRFLLGHRWGRTIVIVEKRILGDRWGAVEG